MTHIASIQMREGRVGFCFISAEKQIVLGCHLDRPPFNRTIQRLKGVDGIETVIIAPGMPAQPFVKAFEKIGTVSVKYFDEERGGAILTEHSAHDISERLRKITRECKEALSAAWAAANMEVAQHCIKFTFEDQEAVMLLPGSTVVNLELVCKDLSLLKVLNHTKTKMGHRFLRSAILAPLLDVGEITRRQDAIQELYDGQTSDLEEQLKSLPDVDRLCADIAQIRSTEKALTTILALKKALIDIDLLKDSVTFESPILQEAVAGILSPRLRKLASLIEQVINEDATFVSGSNLMRHQRCYAVKPNFSALLDVARQTYKEAIDDTYALFKSLVDEHSLPMMRLQHNNTTGYFLQMPVEPPDHGDFLNVVKSGKMWLFSTMELIKANARIEDSLAEVYNLSDAIITELIITIQDDMDAIYEASSGIALVDFLLSLAKVAIKEAYVRPQFTTSLAIKQGRHPLKEHVGLFVANDTFANDRTRFQLITGANMSGKSTYVKQIALLSIMAQMGSFVPAEYAAFRIFDKILTRLANDNMPKMDHSSFSLELTEVHDILLDVTPKSLVIIDEFGRGTSTADGQGIAFAVSERLIKLKPLVFFVTHFEHLVAVLDNYAAVHCQYLETTIDPYQHHHRIAEGRGESYGLECARMLGMPEDVMTIAYEVRAQLMLNQPTPSTEISKKKKIVNALWQLFESDLDNATLLFHLRKLQESCKDDDE